MSHLHWFLMHIFTPAWMLCRITKVVLHVSGDIFRFLGGRLRLILDHRGVELAPFSFPKSALTLSSGTRPAGQC